MKVSHSIPHFLGGQGHLDVQPHWVTALAYPQHKGPLDGRLGLSMDQILIGRLDGSIGLLEIIDTSKMTRTELDHCYRKNGTVPLTINLILYNMNDNIFYYSSVISKIFCNVLIDI